MRERECFFSFSFQIDAEISQKRRIYGVKREDKKYASEGVNIKEMVPSRRLELPPDYSD